MSEERTEDTAPAGRQRSQGREPYKPYTRKKYSQRLGEFLKQLRESLYGKVTEDGGQKTEVGNRTSDSRHLASEQPRLPYVD